MNLPMAFAGSPLDRADNVRADPSALARAMEGARLLRLDGLDPPIGEDCRLIWSAMADAGADSDFVFLGLDDKGRGCFAEVPGASAGSTAPATPSARAFMSGLPRPDLGIYGTARSLVDWHARHRFCARCGGQTELRKGGWQRTCTREGCGAEHFPRVDPVTIMLVEHDGRMLLGRQPRFPARFYSTLAGFVEPGETIEEAVAREVLEEAGVRVRDVSYIASQPWPFPSSLMIGCHAIAENDDLRIDTTELDDARWFTRAEVAGAFEALEAGRPDEGAFTAPPDQAIAHHLMRWWLDRG